MSNALPNRADVVVIGAGPAGLAATACLRRQGLDPVLLEREDRVAPTWSRHYDRLHLHTSRSFSGLPYLRMPRSYPRYPSRDQVVAYLESYAREMGAAPHLGVAVEGIERSDGAGDPPDETEAPDGPSTPGRRSVSDPGPDRWTVRTSVGTVRSRAVVVATGANGDPVRPTWPGLESFPGPVLHSSGYTNGAQFEGMDVLVVGFGNSGGEIALDLLEHGARPTVSVRGPVNVIPRDVLGVPILAIALPLSKLPPGLADALSWPLLKLYYPSYARLGLRKAKVGPFRQIAQSSHVPLLDIGTIRQIRGGRIQVRPGIEHFQQQQVVFADQGRRTFDAVVLATGYRPRVPMGPTGEALGRHPLRGPGLYYCGFYVSPTGMFREVGLEARWIAGHVKRGG